jgi:hypothetical protein
VDLCCATFRSTLNHKPLFPGTLTRTPIALTRLRWYLHGANAYVPEFCIYSSVWQYLHGAIRISSKISICLVLTQLQKRGKSSVFVHCNYAKYKAMIVHKKGSESNQTMLYGLVMSFIQKLSWSQIYQFRHVTFTGLHAEVCRYICI